VCQAQQESQQRFVGNCVARLRGSGGAARTGAPAGGAALYGVRRIGARSDRAPRPGIGVQDRGDGLAQPFAAVRPLG
jgi:hypothetical protein